MCRSLPLRLPQDPLAPLRPHLTTITVTRLTVRDGAKFCQTGRNPRHDAKVCVDWHAQAGGHPIGADPSHPCNHSPEGQIAFSQHIRSGLVDEAMPRAGIDAGPEDYRAIAPAGWKSSDSGRPTSANASPVLPTSFPTRWSTRRRKSLPNQAMILYADNACRENTSVNLMRRLKPSSTSQRPARTSRSTSVPGAGCRAAEVWKAMHFTRPNQFG